MVYIPPSHAPGGDNDDDDNDYDHDDDVALI